VATRKDQLDAFNFARRRMVANLVAPTATGSDEGAPRPVRTFATSIILSAVAVAAVAVLGVFKPSAPSGWQAGLAVDSSSGAAYIDQNNQLHAIYNITSARLLLGGKFQKFDVPDSTLNGSGIPVGSPVGILGAPEDVPAAGNMNLRQWSLCQNESDPNNETVANGNTYLEVGYWPTVASTPQGQWTTQSGTAIIVHDTANEMYLIDGNYKYPLGSDDQATENTVQQLLQALNQNNPLVNGNVTGFWVSDAWLSAFATGSAITFPKLDNLDDPTSGSNQLGQVGQYGPASAGGGGYVQTADGVVKLNTFAYDLYTANPSLKYHSVKPFSAGVLTQSAVDAANSGGTPNAANVFDSGTYGSNWPDVAPALEGTDTSTPGNANVCVGYNGASDGGAAVLTTWLSGQLPYGTPSTQFGLSQPGSTTYANVVMVRPGYGLIAQGSNGGSTGSGSDYLIEDSGYRYALLSDNTTTSGSTTTVSAINQLGYADVAVETVPAGLLDLIQSGTELDPDKAGQTPGNG
jgi:type VII secretion protein EccB